MGLVLTAVNVGSDHCLKRPYACGNDTCQQAADGRSAWSGSDSLNIFITDPGEGNWYVNSIYKWHHMGQ